MTQPTTFRPVRKLPEGTDPLRVELADYAETQGKLLSEVQRLIKDHEFLRVEHETYTRTIVQTQITLEEILENQRVVKRVAERVQKVVPIAVAALEIVRQVLSHMGVIK